MRSSDLLAIAIAAALSLGAPCARAQQTPDGFASERFYASAPGAGWLVMDDLAMRGKPGGVIALTTGYAHDPVVVADGVHRFALVSDQSFATLGAAVTYDRFRLYLDLSRPLVSNGDSGTVGGYTLTGPAVDLGTAPDLLSDVRVGFDARILGEATSAFRLGAGAQLYVPSADRASYVTDGTYRAMGRVLFAGDVGSVAYAGHVGAHLRPLDDSPAPGSPRGSELLFGVAAGPRFAVGGASAVVGPEIFGATPFSDAFGATTTALEALLGARVEGTGDGPQLRLKLGGGGGLLRHFGAPEWRFVVGIELFDRARK